MNSVYNGFLGYLNLWFFVCWFKVVVVFVGGVRCMSIYSINFLTSVMY